MKLGIMNNIVWKSVIISILIIITAGIKNRLFGQNSPITDPPNIIIFFTDDQGYGDVGSYGAEGFETPNFDRLAQEGLKFTDFYVPATVCTPSRAGLLTGKYPKRVGLHEAVIFPYSEGGLDPKEYTLAELLKDNGYSTSMIGKWHLGHQQEKFMPNNQGFDYFYGVPYSNDMNNHYYKKKDFQAPPLPVYHNNKIVEKDPDQRYLTKRYTEKTIQRIRAAGQDQPFFIYLAHSMPHQPLHASPKFKGKSEKGLYGDVIMELDWSVGRIVEALKEEGVYNNTIFIFTSDNGPVPRVGGSAGPLRGKKAQTWEGGQRVPGIIVWPDEIPAGTISSELVSTLDLFPTLAKLTGSSIPSGKILDGRDISQLLKNPNEVTLPKRAFYYYARNGELEAMRWGEWKLHIAKSRGWNPENKSKKFPVSLYYLGNDIGESNNVAGLYPDIVEKMKKMMKNFDNKLTNFDR